MARLVSVALLSALWVAPAAGQVIAHDDGWRIAEPPPFASSELRLPAAEISRKGRFGFGLFGIKREKAHDRPVTVRDVEAPRQRRAGVGFSLKF